MLRLKVMMTHLDHFIMYLGNYFAIRCDGLGRDNKGQDTPSYPQKSTNEIWKNRGRAHTKEEIQIVNK